jgi:hypothetical protein
MKKILMAALLVAALPTFVLAQAPAPADAPASDATIRELIEVTHARDLMNSSMGQLDGLLEKAMKDALQGKNVNAEQEKIIAEFRARMVELLRAEMSWEKMQTTYFRMYRETFTQAELDGMLAFYKTDAGKALIAKMPRMMQSLMQEMMGLMQAIMPKVRGITEEYVEKVKAAA